MSERITEEELAEWDGRFRAGPPLENPPDKVISIPAMVDRLIAEVRALREEIGL